MNKTIRNVAIAIMLANGTIPQIKLLSWSYEFSLVALSIKAKASGRMWTIDIDKNSVPEKVRAMLMCVWLRKQDDWDIKLPKIITYMTITTTTTNLIRIRPSFSEYISDLFTKNYYCAWSNWYIMIRTWSIIIEASIRDSYLTIS